MYRKATAESVAISCRRAAARSMMCVAGSCFPKPFMEESTVAKKSKAAKKKAAKKGTKKKGAKKKAKRKKKTTKKA